MRKLILAVCVAALVGCGSSSSDSNVVFPRVPKVPESPVTDPKVPDPDVNEMYFIEEQLHENAFGYEVVNNVTNDVGYYSISTDWHEHDDNLKVAHNEIWSTDKGVSYSNRVFDYYGATTHQIDMFIAYTREYDIPNECEAVGGTFYRENYTFVRTIEGLLDDDGEFVPMTHHRYEIQWFTSCIGADYQTIDEYDGKQRRLFRGESIQEVESYLEESGVDSVYEDAKWENNRQDLDELQRDTGMDYERDIL